MTQRKANPLSADKWQSVAEDRQKALDNALTCISELQEIRDHQLQTIVGLRKEVDTLRSNEVDREMFELATLRADAYMEVIEHMTMVIARK